MFVNRGISVGHQNWARVSILCIVGAWGLQGLYTERDHSLQDVQGLDTERYQSLQDNKCSNAGENCDATKCCIDTRNSCFRKHQDWAGCRPECAPGIDLNDPEDARSPWSCEILGSNRSEPAVNLSQLVHREVAQDSVPEIEIYVVNMDTRVDRCKCMQQRLAGLPYPIYRQRAVPHTECMPELREGPGGGRNRTSEMSLFCSNYKLWQKALTQSQNDGDFIVIFEDDVDISGKFLEMAPRLLKECNDANYIVFDPFFRPEWTKDNETSHWEEDRVEGHCLNRVMGSKNKLYSPRNAASQFWGSAATIIRKSYLPILVKQAQLTGMTAIDQWWVRIDDNTTFAAVNPEFPFIQQGAIGCAQSVIESNIAATEIKSVITPSTAATEIHGRTPLECLAD